LQVFFERAYEHTKQVMEDQNLHLAHSIPNAIKVPVSTVDAKRIKGSMEELLTV
jgi:hypothetical protein